MSESIHIISLGAGVQSSTMALMASRGEITPMPRCAIFADTQAEPKEVYEWLSWLEGQLRFPVYRVTNGNLKQVALTIRDKEDGSGQWAKTVIPTYILNKDGSRGIVQRQCTYDFKMLPLIREAKRVAFVEIEQFKARAKCADKAPEPICQWIGISVDEVSRMKESRDPLIKHRWPLVEIGWNRAKCLQWWEDHGMWSPPRSACVFCPYHSNAEWRRLKLSSPAEFQEAVDFEVKLQSVKRTTNNMRGIPFLHNSLKPLSEVDFSTEEERGQLSMFNNECEGMCGV